jgi:adenosine deaminase
LDLAGDEAGYPLDAHIKAFEYAFSRGIPCTAHAGEAKGAGSIRETLSHLRPQRIGHGVRCVEDTSVIKELLERGIHLELCPTSNIQVNVFKRLQDHPVDVLFKKGLSLSINTDGRTLSDTTLQKEYRKLESAFGWRPEHFIKCNLQALSHAFAPPGLKEQIRRRLMAAYAPES